MHRDLAISQIVTRNVPGGLSGFHPVLKGLANVVAAAPLALSLPGAGAANDLVPPDPWQIIHSARALGPADVGRDDFRDPQITGVLAGPEGGAPGLPYTITFYGCDLGRDCTSILLTMRLADPKWARTPPSPSVLGDWNGRKLVGRAWIDAAGRAVLDHAVVIGPGLPEKTLAATLTAWATAMWEFAEHIDFEPK